MSICQICGKSICGEDLLAHEMIEHSEVGEESRWNLEPFFPIFDLRDPVPAMPRPDS